MALFADKSFASLGNGGEEVKGVRKVVALLLVLAMLGTIVSPAVAAEQDQKDTCSTCRGGTCPSGNSDVTIIDVEGPAKNKKIAKALKDSDVKKIIAKLKENGHKVNLGKAVVKEVISDNSKVSQVIIPLKAADGYEKAVLEYAVTENGQDRAFAMETYKKNGENYASAYYVDVDGNVVVQSGDEEYWICVGICLGQFCAENYAYCQICGYNCYICIAAPDPVFCGLCLVCLGAPAAYCGIDCAV